jgi:hypothetical protein
MRNRILALSCIVLVGFLLMYFAPGNKVRESHFPENHQLVHSIFYSVLQAIRFSAKWIFSPALLIASACYLPIAYNYRLPESFRLKPFVLPGILFSIVFLCVFPAYWSTGILGQHRTLNVACFFFILFWFFILHQVPFYIPMNERILSRIRRFQKNIGMLLLFLALLFTGNSFTSWRDILTGEAQQFNKEMNQRAAFLHQCRDKGESNCKVPALSVRPESIFVLDLQADSSHWINFDYAFFYNLNSVSISNDIYQNEN